MFLDLDKQLLLYIKGKDGIKKSRVVNTIKMGFTLFGRRRKLIISTPTNSIANDVSKSTVYTIIGISSWARKNYQIKVHTKWLYHSFSIINKISIIGLKLLTSMDKQIQKTKVVGIDSIIVFGELSLVVLMGDFYQFMPVLVRFLEDNLVRNEKMYAKNLWDRFTLVLTLKE